MRNSLMQSGYHSLVSSYVFVLLISLVLGSSSSADTQTFFDLSIDTANGWTHRIEESKSAAEGMGQLITIFHPDAVGELRLLTYEAPALVDELRLRNLTNIDSSLQLVREEWGSFSGYQYSYIEYGSFF